MYRPRGAVLVLCAGALAAIAMIAVVARAVSSSPPATTHEVQLHLPNLDQMAGGENACAPAVYPPRAEFRYERCRGETPVGWPACSTVTYTADPTHAPVGYQADLASAVSKVERATGLRLVAVAARPNISIGWDPSLYDPRPGTSGEAGVTSFRSTGAHATSASVSVSSHLTAGSRSGVGEEPILLHELGHAVGLAHYDGAVAMNPLDRGFADYQPGDLAGLARLYHPASCR